MKIIMTVIIIITMGLACPLSPIPVGVLVDVRWQTQIMWHFSLRGNGRGRCGYEIRETNRRKKRKDWIKYWLTVRSGDKINSRAARVKGGEMEGQKDRWREGDRISLKGLWLAGPTAAFQLAQALCCRELAQTHTHWGRGHCGKGHAICQPSHTHTYLQH